MVGCTGTGPQQIIDCQIAKRDVQQAQGIELLKDRLRQPIGLVLIESSVSHDNRRHSEAFNISRDLWIQIQFDQDANILRVLLREFRQVLCRIRPADREQPCRTIGYRLLNNAVGMRRDKDDSLSIAATKLLCGQRARPDGTGDWREIVEAKASTLKIAKGRGATARAGWAKIHSSAEQILDDTGSNFGC